MSISTHVLDVVAGAPAQGVRVELEAQAPDGEWGIVAWGVTDSDGRVADLVAGTGSAGRHRIVFDTGGWAAEQAQDTFYPRVTVEFVVTDPATHHHVPLLLSPFGYTTYRGS